MPTRCYSLRVAPRHSLDVNALVIALISFFALLVLAGLAEGIGGFRHWVHLRHLGRLPLGIVWFGAMGGSLASLKCLKRAALRLIDTPQVLVNLLGRR
jgi:hypothetical protein